MNALPRPPLIFVSAEVLLDISVELFDAPANLGPRHQLLQGRFVDAPTHPGFEFTFFVVIASAMIFLEQQPAGFVAHPARIFPCDRPDVDPVELVGHRLLGSLIPRDLAPVIVADFIGDFFVCLGRYVFRIGWVLAVRVIFRTQELCLFGNEVERLSRHFQEIWLGDVPEFLPELPGLTIVAISNDTAVINIR